MAETVENTGDTKVGTLSPQSEVPADQLISRLSYSHLELIVDLEDETQRAFYEREAIRGNWSVRELKRQIGSLYFERSGLSQNKAKLSELANQSAEQNTQLNIRDPYIFEFLGQLNAYVAYYKKHEMTPGDQSPVGILLCTRKNEALFEFALGDLSNKVFVSRYAVELPKKEEMQRFIAQLGQEAGE